MKKYLLEAGIGFCLLGIIFLAAFVQENTVIAQNVQTQLVVVDLLHDYVEFSAPVDTTERRVSLSEATKQRLAELDPTTSLISVTFDLNGECLLNQAEDEGDDASAFFFQIGSEWRWVNLGYLQDLGLDNCSDDPQVLEIPFSRFRSNDGMRSLEPALVTDYGFRFHLKEEYEIVVTDVVALEYLPPSC